MDLFFTQILGSGEVHPETAPLQALCCALRSTEMSTFGGGAKGKKVPKKAEEEGWQAKGARQDAQNQVRQHFQFADAICKPDLLGLQEATSCKCIAATCARSGATS